MKKNEGKISIASLLAFAFIAYVAFGAFIFISTKLKSDNTQKEITEKILKFKRGEKLPAKAMNVIITTLEQKGFTLTPEDKKQMEVFYDTQRRTVDLYYVYRYTLDFLFFKHEQLVEVEETRSTERYN